MVFWSFRENEKLRFGFCAFQPQVQGNKGMIGPRGIGRVALGLAGGQRLVQYQSSRVSVWSCVQRMEKEMFYLSAQLKNVLFS